MSCGQYTKYYENALERFWELMEDCSFKLLIYKHFLSHEDQWKEKEFGFNEDPYNNAFDYLFEWGGEAFGSDIKKCVNNYINTQV